MLNDMQKATVDAVLSPNLDDIKKLPIADQNKAYQCIIDFKFYASNQAWLKEKNITEDVGFIKRILEHPHPQNRATGDPSAIPLDREIDDKNEDEKNAIYQGNVYYWNENKTDRLCEPVGLLGLTKYNKDVTKADVVNYIQNTIKKSLKQPTDYFSLIQQIHFSGNSTPSLIFKELLRSYLEYNLDDENNKIDAKLFSNKKSYSALAKEFLSTIQTNRILTLGGIYSKVKSQFSPIDSSSEFAKLLSAFFSYYPIPEQEEVVSAKYTTTDIKDVKSLQVPVKLMDQLNLKNINDDANLLFMQDSLMRLKQYKIDMKKGPGSFGINSDVLESIGIIAQSTKNNDLKELIKQYINDYFDIHVINDYSVVNLKSLAFNFVIPKNIIDFICKLPSDDECYNLKKKILNHEREINDDNIKQLIESLTDSQKRDLFNYIIKKDDLYRVSLRERIYYYKIIGITAQSINNFFNDKSLKDEYASFITSFMLPAMDEMPLMISANPVKLPAFHWDEKSEVLSYQDKFIKCIVPLKNSKMFKEQLTELKDMTWFSVNSDSILKLVNQHCRSDSKHTKIDMPNISLVYPKSRHISAIDGTFIRIDEKKSSISYYKNLQPVSTITINDMKSFMTALDKITKPHLLSLDSKLQWKLILKNSENFCLNLVLDIREYKSFFALVSLLPESKEKDSIFLGCGNYM